MRAILFLTLLLSTLGVYSQTQPSLPSGTVPYSTNLYRATDGSIWTGKTGNYTNLGNKQYVDSLSSLGYTNEMIDSIALYNYDRARNRINHTGTQAQSTVVNLVSDLAGKENISNKVTSLSSPNDTTYPTSKAVSDAINAIPPTEVELGSGLYKDGDGKINLGLDVIGGVDGLLTEDLILQRPSITPGGYSSFMANTFGSFMNATNGEQTTGINTTYDLDAGAAIEIGKITTDDGSQSLTFGFGYFGNKITLSDGINQKGLEYAGDYSANWTDHSLVTKKWVTDNFSGGGGSQTLQDVTDEGNTTNNVISVTGNNNSTGINLQGLSIRHQSGVSTINSRGNGQFDQGQINFTNDYISISKGTGDYQHGLKLNIPADNSITTAEFINSRVKGEDAVNDDEFITKAQLESATNNQIISIRGVTTAWDSVSLDFMSFNIYNLASDNDAVYLKITNRSDRELSYRVVRSALPGQSTGTISSMGQSTDIPIQDAGTGMTNFSVFILDYLDSYKVVGIYDILVAGAYDDDLHPSFWRINTLYEDNPTSPIE